MKNKDLKFKIEFDYSDVEYIGNYVITTKKIEILNRKFIIENKNIIFLINNKIQFDSVEKIIDEYIKKQPKNRRF